MNKEKLIELFQDYYFKQNPTYLFDRDCIIKAKKQCKEFFIYWAYQFDYQIEDQLNFIDCL